MSTVQILVIVGVVWFVVASIVGLVIGRVIRNRDRPPRARKRPQNWPNRNGHP